MIKSQVATGALLPLCCRSPTQKSFKRHGASSFKNVIDGEYIQRTITLGEPTITGRPDGKYDVAIELKRLGDSVHTFVLKNASEFDTYELLGVASFPLQDKVNAYQEGMSYWTNLLLAEADGWEVTKDTFPLMIGMTSNPEENHLPLIAAYGNGENHVWQDYQLLIRGLADREAAERLQLDVDYVYFDSPTRKHLATHQYEFPEARNVCNFYTMTETVPVSVSRGLLTVPFDQANEWCKLDNVAGVMIHSSGDGNHESIKEVAMFINGFEFCAWKSDDAHIYWKKVGLRMPGTAILLPFSRNMWSRPHQAAFVDFSRIDKIGFAFGCDPDVKELKVDITALGYRTRVMDPTYHIFRTV